MNLKQASPRLSVTTARAIAPVQQRAQLQRRSSVIVRADNSSRADSNFLSGFLLGGVIFGTLGFVFAPQISKALLGDDQRIKLPRFLEEDAPKDPEQTKQDLIEKIAQLNASIDDVAAQLKVKEAEPIKVDATA